MSVAAFLRDFRFWLTFFINLFIIASYFVVSTQDLGLAIFTGICTSEIFFWLFYRLVFPMMFGGPFFCWTGFLYFCFFATMMSAYHIAMCIFFYNVFMRGETPKSSKRYHVVALGGSLAWSVGIIIFRIALFGPVCTPFAPGLVSFMAGVATYYFMIPLVLLVGGSIFREIKETDENTKAYRTSNNKRYSRVILGLVFYMGFSKIPAYIAVTMAYLAKTRPPWINIATAVSSFTPLIGGLVLIHLRNLPAKWSILFPRACKVCFCKISDSERKLYLKQYHRRNGLFGERINKCVAPPEISSRSTDKSSSSDQSGKRASSSTGSTTGPSRASASTAPTSSA